MATGEGKPPQPCEKKGLKVKTAAAILILLALPSLAEARCRWVQGPYGPYWFCDGPWTSPNTPPPAPRPCPYGPYTCG
jgi:hypothetical protein